MSGTLRTVRQTLHICAPLILFAFIQLVLVLGGPVSPAMAQATCPAQNPSSNVFSARHSASADTGICSASAFAIGTGSDTTFTGANLIQILGPRELDVPGAGTSRLLQVYGNDGGGVAADAAINASSSCAAGTEINITNITATRLGVEIIGSRTCDLTVTIVIGGVTYTYVGAITRAFNSYRLGTATITGGAFGTPPPEPTAQDKSNIVAALQSSFNAATPGVLDTLNGAGGNGQGGNGVTFAPTGLGFAQSRIDTANPLDRDFGAAFADRGYFDGGRKLRRGNGFNFSVNLNRLSSSSGAVGQARASGPENDNSSLSPRGSSPGSIGLTAGLSGGLDPGNESRDDSLSYGTGGIKDSAPAPQSRITSFIKGEYVDFDDGETNADRDGHLWVVTSGLGLRVSPSTTIGLLSRYRTGEADSNALNAELDSDFWGGGAFLTTTISGGLKVALAGLYESGDNDIRIGTATGSFDSEHVTLEGRVDKRLQRGRFWIEPGVGIRYVDTEQDNYTDSTGTLVVNQDLTLGRLTYGPKIGTTLHRGNATVKPYATLNGVWDFDNDGNFVTSTAGTFTSADLGLNFGGGLEVTYLSGLSIRLDGDWTTYDTDLEVWSVTGGIGSPLAALGLGQVGFVSLDLSANAQDASAQARLRIPLGGAE